MLAPGPATLIWLAVMVEFLTETIRENCPGANNLPAGIMAIGIGILLCGLTGTGILQVTLNYIHAPVIDYILTGLIISRGSGMVHDLIAALTLLVRAYLRRLSP